MIRKTRRSEKYLEMRLKEAEGCSEWQSLSATSRSWKKVDVVKRKARVDDNEGGGE
jgi:hypothetical protein